jgi:hypothetical protein
MALLNILEFCLAAGLLITPTHAAYVLKKNYSGTNFTSGFNFRTVRISTLYFFPLDKNLTVCTGGRLSRRR